MRIFSDYDQAQPTDTELDHPPLLKGWYRVDDATAKLIDEAIAADAAEREARDKDRAKHHLWPHDFDYRANLPHFDI